MPNLSFEVGEAEARPYSVSPLLVFKLRVANEDNELPIHTITLRCQIQLEVTRRRYNEAEQERLHDLFGEPERWNQTLRKMLWTHTSVVVTHFKGVTTVDLPVPCTFDFNVAATKYFAGLEDGDVPLCFQFSGTVFYSDSKSALQVAQIPWDKE